MGSINIQSQEDPSPNAFTEAFTFFGGSYIVFPGQLSEPTFILKRLNTAIFLNNKFNNHNDFKNKVYGMNRGLLEISDIIAIRGGLTRNMAPKTLSKRIFIPSDIDEKKWTVVFSIRDIEEILNSVDINFTSLEPFIQPFGQLDTSSYDFQNSPIQKQPIIYFEEKYIIAYPWMLLASLTHQILLAAKEYKVLGLLFEQFQTAILHSVGSSLNRLGHEQLPHSFRIINSKLNIRESLWSLDTG